MHRCFGRAIHWIVYLVLLVVLSALIFHYIYTGSAFVKYALEFKLANGKRANSREVYYNLITGGWKGEKLDAFIKPVTWTLVYGQLLLSLLLANFILGIGAIEDVIVYALEWAYDYEDIPCFEWPFEGDRLRRKCIKAGFCSSGWRPC